MGKLVKQPCWAAVLSARTWIQTQQLEARAVAPRQHTEVPPDWGRRKSHRKHAQDEGAARLAAEPLPQNHKADTEHHLQTCKTTFKLSLNVKRPDHPLDFVKTTTPRSKGRTLSTACFSITEGQTGPYASWWLRAQPPNHRADGTNRRFLNSRMEAGSPDVSEEIACVPT